MTSRQLLGLSPSAQRQIARQKSRDLGKGNGPSVRPSTNSDHFAGCDKMVGANQSTATWFRTASQGSQIVPVKVVASGKDWLDLVTPNGAIQRTRTDGADSYWPTYLEAWNAVEKRLQEDIRVKTCEYNDFLNGQTISEEPANPGS